MDTYRERNSARGHLDESCMPYTSFLLSSCILCSIRLRVIERRPMQDPAATAAATHTALASIPSLSSESSRVGSLGVHRSPAQTSVAPLLQDTRDADEDDPQPASASLDQDFPQSGEDSLRRKSRRRSFFRRDDKRRPSVVTSFIGQYDADVDQDDGALHSPRQEQGPAAIPAVASSPVKMLVAPHPKSPTLARNPTTPQQVSTGSPEDPIPIDVFAQDAGERHRAEREVADLIQEEAAQVRDGKSQSRFGPRKLTKVTITAVLYENQRGQV